MTVADTSTGTGKEIVKKKKKSRKRPAKPKPGDPGYKTPTQLRNARKRRKKKEERAAINGGHPSKTTTVASENLEAEAQISSGHINNNKDPSLKYLSNPRAAPTVRNAIKFFREKTNAQAGTSHDAYFPVTVGPKLGWRTVARLAVQAREAKGGKRKLRIGLFVPGSHELLPVPDCPVHHRKINVLVKALEDECNALGVPAFDASEAADVTGRNTFGLRYIAVAIERSTQKQQLVLVWKEDAADSAAKNEILGRLIQRLVELSGKQNRKDVLLHSVWVHYNNTWKHANSIFDRAGRWETRFVDGCGDAKKLEDDPLCGSIREAMLPLLTPKKGKEETGGATGGSGNEIHVPLYFPPQVFRQANLDGFARIIVRIREWLEQQQPSRPPVADRTDQFQTPEDPSAPPRRKRRRGRRDTSNANYVPQRGKDTTADAPSNSTRATLGHCLELYGGVGTIGLNLADLFDSIESSDENPYNEKCFHAAADELKVNGTLLDPSKRSQITYTSKSASDVVAQHHDSLRNARVVLVDPPRKGLDPPVVEALCSEYGPRGNGGEQQHQALIYVSCGFDAFRRDYRALVEKSGKWTLDCAEGHVLFPGSDAIETLAFFTRTK